MRYDIPDLTVASHLTSQEHVYRRLRHAIMVGAFAPGQALTMRGLADALDLSPTPIREALRRLNSEGAIVAQDNRRMMVPPMTRGRFDDLIATRITLETHAARRALPFVSDHLIEKMTKLDVDMDTALRNGDYDALTVLNHRFHRTFYTANPDQTAQPLVESIWLQLGPFQRQVLSRIGQFEEDDRHKDILAALSHRDSDALERAIRQDIEDGVGAIGRDTLVDDPDG